MTQCYFFLIKQLHLYGSEICGGGDLEVRIIDKLQLKFLKNNLVNKKFNAFSYDFK